MDPSSPMRDLTLSLTTGEYSALQRAAAENMRELGAQCRVFLRAACGLPAPPNVRHYPDDDDDDEEEEEEEEVRV